MRNGFIEVVLFIVGYGLLARVDIRLAEGIGGLHLIAAGIGLFRG
jgi:hypothetical protein